jgi:hypothetical protein
MQQARSAPNKALWSAAIAGAFVIGLVALAGCTMMGDNLTGVKAHRSDTNSCIKDCNDRYKDLYSQEQALHLSNIDACQALSQPDKDACLAAEDARHQAAMEALGTGKVECQNNCHRQGSGLGS